MFAYEILWLSCVTVAGLVYAYRSSAGVTVRVSPLRNVLKIAVRVVLAASC